MSPGRVVVSLSEEDFSATAARETVDILERALTGGSRAAVALAGGSTPIPVYREMATSFRDRLEWERVDLFFGDERAVAPDDEESNFRSVSQALAPILTRASLHRIRGELGATAAAADYEKSLIGHFGRESPRFDLAILGVGEDGHTASLFPGSDEAERPDAALVVATTSPRKPRDRITLGYDLLAGAGCVLFLVRGRSKAKVVADVWSGECDLPAAKVCRCCPNVRWVLDPAAAENLTGRSHGPATAGDSGHSRR